jgi:hypothetical protein
MLPETSSGRVLQVSTPQLWASWGFSARRFFDADRETLHPAVGGQPAGYHQRPASLVVDAKSKPPSLQEPQGDSPAGVIALFRIQYERYSKGVDFHTAGHPKLGG